MLLFICISNPMPYAGNNYRKLNDKNELTIEKLSAWNEICKLNYSINVMKEIIDIRDEFKEC